MPQTTEDDEDEDESHQPLDQPYDFDPEKVNLRLGSSCVLLIAWFLAWR